MTARVAALIRLLQCAVVMLVVAAVAVAAVEAILSPVRTGSASALVWLAFRCCRIVRSSLAAAVAIRRSCAEPAMRVARRAWRWWRVCADIALVSEQVRQSRVGCALARVCCAVACPLRCLCASSRLIALLAHVLLLRFRPPIGVTRCASALSLHSVDAGGRLQQNSTICRADDRGHTEANDGETHRQTRTVEHSDTATDAMRAPRKHNAASRPLSQPRQSQRKTARIKRCKGGNGRMTAPECSQRSGTSGTLGTNPGTHACPRSSSKIHRLQTV